MSDGDGKKNGAKDSPEQDRPPKIDYPTVYAFKVMGKAENDFFDYVRKLFGRLIGVEVAPDSMTEQPSSKGTYTSITVSVFLTDEAQRVGIYAELHKDPRIVYYL